MSPRGGFCLSIKSNEMTEASKTVKLDITNPNVRTNFIH